MALHWKSFEPQQDAAKINCGHSLLFLGRPNYLPPSLSFEDFKQRILDAAWEVFLKKSDEEGSSSIPRLSSSSYSPSPFHCLAFSTDSQIDTAESCLALYHRTPCLVYSIRGGDTEEEKTYVLDFIRAVPFNAARDVYVPYESPRAYRRQVGAWVNTEFETLVHFLTNVKSGKASSAFHGAPSPAYFHFPLRVESHGVLLLEAKCGVTGTLPLLLPVPTPGYSITSMSGTFAVLWSSRCPCCPIVMMLAEHAVALLRGVAEGLSFLGQCDSPTRKCCRSEGRCRSGPHRPVTQLFQFFVLNISENDIPEEKLWPLRDIAEDGSAVNERTIPALLAFPPPSPSTLTSTAEHVSRTYDYESQWDSLASPVLFQKEKRMANVLEFIVNYCLQETMPECWKGTSYGKSCEDWRKQLLTLSLEVLDRHDIDDTQFFELVDVESESFQRAIAMAQEAEKRISAERPLSEIGPESCGLIKALKSARGDLLDMRTLGCEYVMEKFDVPEGGTIS